MKDLLLIIQDKETDIRVFDNDVEIDYDKAADYKDKYVVNISIGTDKAENNKPYLNIYLSGKVELIYLPYLEK